MVFYELGDFTLDQFSQLRNDIGIYYYKRPGELMFIFAELYSLIEILFKHGVFHGDIKP